MSMVEVRESPAARGVAVAGMAVAGLGALALLVVGGWALYASATAEPLGPDEDASLYGVGIVLGVMALTGAWLLAAVALGIGAAVRLWRARVAVLALVVPVVAAAVVVPVVVFFQAVVF
ncbi:hypothetical protein [Nocardioides sp. YIM 152588]|uniref:hypothetical protein n=1 Tax=Nocardioides sp. YIM 152588 TaxID=3158259 RepID=UPI0032E52EFD